MDNVTKRIMAGVIVALLLPVWNKALQAETLTLTTYYPAPYGAYKKIVTTNQTILARDTGRVGIGTSDPQTKLDVNGLVKLGSDTTTTCATALTGALRYNSDAAIKAVEYCDGTTWRRIDSATGWITVHSGGTYQEYGGGYGDNIAWLYWNDNIDHSPTKICKDAGYSDYSGACKTTNSRFTIRGATVYMREGTYSRLSCLYGSYPFSGGGNGGPAEHANSATQILCTK